MAGSTARATNKHANTPMHERQGMSAASGCGIASQASTIHEHSVTWCMHVHAAVSIRLDCVGPLCQITTLVIVWACRMVTFKPCTHIICVMLKPRLGTGADCS